MNQVTTGCANCYYNFNGYCTYGNICSGVTCQKQTFDGNSITVPLDAPITKGFEIKSDGQIFIPRKCSDSPIYGLGSLGIPQVKVNCIVCGKEMIVNDPYQPAKVCDECKKAIEWAKGQVATARKVKYDPARLKEIMEEKVPIKPATVDMITEGKAEALELIKEKLSLDKITSFILSRDLMEGKLTLLNIVEFILAEIKKEPEPSGVKAGIEAEKESSLEYGQKKDPNGFRISVKEFVQRFVAHGKYIVLRMVTIIPKSLREELGTNEYTDKSYVWKGNDYLITDEDGTCEYKDFPVIGVFNPDFDNSGLYIGIDIGPFDGPMSSSVHEELGILGK